MPLEIRNRHLLRYISLGFLLLLFFAALLASFFLHGLFIFMALAAAGGTLLVRFKTLKINNTELYFEDRCIYPILFEKRSIPLKEIQEIKVFSKHFDRSFLLLDLINMTSLFRGQSGPLTIGIRTKQKEAYSIAVFGSKKQKAQFLERLQSALKS